MGSEKIREAFLEGHNSKLAIVEFSRHACGKRSVSNVDDFLRR